MLEINERPCHDLRRLIELIGQRRVERELNVHRTTVQRWLDGRVRIPGSRHLAVRSLLGDLPGTAGAWTGWRFHDGVLLSPAGDAYTAGDVMAIGLNRQRIAWLEQEILRLKARLAIAEQGYPQAVHVVHDTGGHPRPFDIIPTSRRQSTDHHLSGSTTRPVAESTSTIVSGGLRHQVTPCP